MTCPSCGCEYEGNFCPKCGKSIEMIANETANKKNLKQRKLLGFRSNKIWKKVLSILYLIFCGLFLISIIATTKYKNITTYDYVIEQINSVMILLIMVSPYIFLSNTKFRDKLPLFKKHNIGASIAGLIIVTIIIGVISGFLDAAHTEEFLADRENHAYTQTVTEATCEEDGEIKRFCEYCGRAETETLPALGHTMKEISKKDPTETNDGEIIKECSVCGKREITTLEKLEAKSSSSQLANSSDPVSSIAKTESKVESAAMDISQYYGSYYSTTECYEISLQEHDGAAFYLQLFYTDGTYDEGYVVPGQQTTLAFNATITLNLNDNGTVHVLLYSAITANGNFDEDLVKGSLVEAVGLRSAAQLKTMSDSERFKQLRQIEQNCAAVEVKDIINHPKQFCNDTIYRIPGVVTWAEGEKFLLQITEDYENDTIVCYSTESVSEGEKICVYGTGTGVGTYTRTYYDGVPSDYEFETLEFKVGYILREESISDIYGADIPDYIQDLIFGEYVANESICNPQYMEKTLTIGSEAINGRPYTINEIKLIATYGTILTDLEGVVSVYLNISTTSKRGESVDMAITIELEGDELTYTLAKQTDTMPIHEFAYYYRTSAVN